MYPIPVVDNSEILEQKPDFIDADGDGTVLATSALCDGYPDFVVKGRFMLKNMRHFSITGEPRMFEIFAD